MDSLSAARYALNPLHRLTIELGPNIDRSQGVYFPEPEGTSFIVEAADFPVLLAPNVSQGAGLGNSLVLRDGLEFKYPFKGWVLQHPSLNRRARATILVLKDGATASNQLNDPVSRLSASYRVISAAGAQVVAGVYIPDGVRAIRNLQAAIAATTFTQAFLTFIDINGAALAAPTSLTRNIASVPTAYPLGSYSVQAQSLYQPSGAGVANFGTIVFPADAVECQITLIGTVLVGNPTVTGNFE